MTLDPDLTFYDEVVFANHATSLHLGGGEAALGRQGVHAAYEVRIAHTGYLERRRIRNPVGPNQKLDVNAVTLAKRRRSARQDRSADDVGERERVLRNVFRQTVGYCGTSHRFSWRHSERRRTGRA